MILTYTKTHNLSQLHDELLVALPALRAVMRVEGGTDGTIRLTVPDDADEPAIATIVNAHSPKAPMTVTLSEPEKTAIRNLAASSGDLTLTQLSNAVRLILKAIRARTGDV